MDRRRLGRIVAPVVLAAIAALAVGAPTSGARRARHLRPHPALVSFDRYSVANGCFTVRTSPGTPLPGNPLRFQAAALGIYLLYTPAGADVADPGSGTPTPESTPSSNAEWVLTGTSHAGFTLRNAATGMAVPVTLTPATGCAVYPDAQVDASGAPFTGASPQGDVLGTVESHAHITAFELFGGDWHCGRPFSPFGAPDALPASCAAQEQGTNGEVEAFLDFGGANRPSDMHGWPTFREWPSPTALAEEGDYYTGVERAWKAGLRIFVTNLVDNEALCSLMTERPHPCNDMASVHIQSADLYALQNYIDAQSGGPGKGFFRIVTDPFQARRVINEGKLAVIEGIEVSRIFGCGEHNDVPECTGAQVDAGLNEVEALGVRTFFPVHEFDNAFGGTKMIAGDTGQLINAGNRLETGSYWTLQPCPADQQDAEQLTAPPAGPLATLLNGPVSSLLHGNPAPVYGSGPQCNTRGLTALGSYLVAQMIRRHLIIQSDHMDSKTATAALAIARAAHYSGIVSAHCCSSPQLFQGIYATGGFVDPPVQPALAFVTQWRRDRALADGRYHFGFGYGSDENGLAQQPGPTAPGISYPFTSYDGHVTFMRERWGDRTFDLNADGLANYGMYADWLHQVQVAGGLGIMRDMFQGAESYLEMWERADGVPSTACLPGHGRATPRGLGHLRLGDSAERALFRAGQPVSRPGRSYRYCTAGAPRRATVSVFDRRGRVALIVTDARRIRAGTLSPGRPLRALRRVRARRLAPGIWVGRRLHGGARFVYGVRAGRVAFVGVATRRTARRRRTLIADIRAAGL